MEIELSYLDGGPGLGGSPILASGRYPFARPAGRAGTACRLYPGASGDQSVSIRQIEAGLADAA